MKGPQALREPAGLETGNALSTKTMAAPGAFLGLPTVAMVCLVLACAALAYGIREYRLAHRDERANGHAVFPVAALAIMFALVIVGWIIQ